MATRIYLPSSGAADVSPAFTASWNSTVGADRVHTAINRRSTGQSTKITAEISGGPKFILLRQFVSNPLAAQTFSGTLKGQIKAAESAAALDATLAILVKVVSNDGTIDRAQLISITASQLNTTPPEFTAAGSINRQFKNASDISNIPITGY